MNSVQNKVTRAVMVAAGLAFVSCVCSATDYTWTGAGASNYWAVAENWSGNTLPVKGAGNRAIFDLGEGNSLTVNKTATDLPATIVVRSGTLTLGANSYTSSGSSSVPLVFDVATGASLITKCRIEKNLMDVIKTGGGSWQHGDILGADSAMDPIGNLDIQEGSFETDGSNTGKILYCTNFIVRAGASARITNQQLRQKTRSNGKTFKLVVTLEEGASVWFSTLNCDAVNGAGTILTGSITIGPRAEFDGLACEFRADHRSGSLTVKNDADQHGHFVVGDARALAGGATVNASSNLLFKADIGEFSISNYVGASGVPLHLEDVDGRPVKVNLRSMSNPANLLTTGSGDLAFFSSANATFSSAALRHTGRLDVSFTTSGRTLTLDGNFDAENLPGVIEFLTAGGLTVNNTAKWNYAGRLIGTAGSAVWGFNGPAEFAYLEHTGGINYQDELTVNSGRIRAYSMSGGTASSVLTFAGDVDVAYTDAEGVNLHNEAGTQTIAGGVVLLDGHDGEGSKDLRQTGGRATFVNGNFRPATGSTAENPSTVTFNGGETFFMANEPFSSTSLNLVLGANGGTFTGFGAHYGLSSSATTFNAPMVSANGVSPDGGFSWNGRTWLRFRYPLAISGPVRLEGAQLQIPANASFEDGTNYFGSGDMELMPGAISVWPRTSGSKVVSIATGNGAVLRVSGSSMLNPRDRDPNNASAAKDPHTFVISDPVFETGGALALADYSEQIGSANGSKVKYANGAPEMSASGRVLKPIYVTTTKVPFFATYDAEDGFKRFGNVVTTVESMTAGAVLEVPKAGLRLAAETYEIEAISMVDWGGIDMNAGTFIRIGDGISPGMVLLSGQHGIEGGNGQLDFLGADAMFVVGSPADSGYYTTIGSRIINARSVSFVSTPEFGTNYRRVALTVANAYACETYVSAVQVYARNERCFSSGTVHVTGGQRFGGQINFDTPGTWANDFELQGWGMSNTIWDGGDQRAGAFSFRELVTLTGDIEVTRPACLSSTASGDGTLTGVISGGAIQLYNSPGTIRFHGHNVYTGGTEVVGATLALKYGDSAGTGAITVDAGSTLLIQNDAEDGDFTLANRLNGSGTISLAGAWRDKVVAFPGMSEAASFTLEMNGRSHAVRSLRGISAVSDTSGRNISLSVLDDAEGSFAGSVPANVTLVYGRMPPVPGMVIFYR